MYLIPIFLKSLRKMLRTWAVSLGATSQDQGGQRKGKGSDPENTWAVAETPTPPRGKAEAARN